MKSLDVKIGEQKAAQKSLFEMYTISLSIKNIGVAFPLTLARDLQMPRTGSHDDSAVRAFLFSIKTLEFGTQLGENGQASMTGFSFQFVSRYDPWIGIYHSGLDVRLLVQVQARESCRFLWGEPQDPQQACLPRDDCALAIRTDRRL